MELAFVTGRGPQLLTNLEGRYPLVRDEDVVVFGFRDAAQAATDGSQPLAPTIRAMDLWSVRERGAIQATRDALAHLERINGPDGSGFTSMSMSSTTRSCLRSTIGFHTV